MQIIDLDDQPVFLAFIKVRFIHVLFSQNVMQTSSVHHQQNFGAKT